MNATRRIWSGLILETRLEVGTAAHRNRGKHSGTARHRLVCEYVVGLVPEHRPAPGSYGARFAETGEPVLFACRPLCGCTRGATAGRPYPGLTDADVTCAACRKTLDRAAARAAKAGD